MVGRRAGPALNKRGCVWVESARGPTERETERVKGEMKGRKEGRTEGREEGRMEEGKDGRKVWRY